MREAQQRFAGDAVAGNKLVFHLSGGKESPPLRTLAPSLEELARHAFVPPERWDAIRLEFRERRTVLLRGTPGHGRMTMAIRLLQTVEARVIYQLDPRIDLARMAAQLTDRKLEPGAAFLLCQPADIGRLDAFTLDSLEAALSNSDARLVITIGSEVSFRDNSLLRYEMGLPKAPSPREILIRHLSHRLDDEDRAADLLRPDDVAELVAETLDRPGVTCEVTAVLANLLSRSGDRVDTGHIRTLLRRRHTDEFDMWFEALGDLEQRCFAIALAVLDGLPFEEVAMAARSLHTRLHSGGPVTLGEDSVLRVTDGEPFQMPPARFLRILQARMSDTNVRTPYGYAPATAISYRDPEYATRVIKRAWHDYRVHDDLLAWLGQLVVAPSDQVRVYAATAVGALARLSFEYIRRRVLQPWARSDDMHHREAAADALRAASSEPALRLAANWLVNGWYSSANATMQSSAALALGTRLGSEDTSQPIRALERLANVDEQAVQIGISRAFASLLAENAESLVSVFFGVIERCLEDPVRRVAGHVIFLLVAQDLMTEVRTSDGVVTRRPTFLHLAQRQPHLRRPLSRFWAQAIAGGKRRGLAELVLRDWASFAESDPEALGALTDMVRQIADIEPAAGSAIGRMSRQWSGGSQLSPMPNVTRALNSALDNENLER